MLREISTIIIIVVLIWFGNYVTENYTRYATDTMINLLDEIDVEDESDFNTEKIEEINVKWNDVKDKMAYYIEHDEL